MNPHENETAGTGAGKIIAKAREFGLIFTILTLKSALPISFILSVPTDAHPFHPLDLGKAYHKMKTQYDYNLGRIYEMVVNSNPCYAFLLEGNSLIQNKLIMAHVLAHCDFFKNNIYFKNTSRDMVESMAAAAERFRNYEFKYGLERVEKFIDAAISIQEHIEPRLMVKEGRRKEQKNKQECMCKRPETPYDDLWSLDEVKIECTCPSTRKFPQKPEKDIMLFVLQHSRELEDWQRDIMSVIRQEMLFLAPDGNQNHERGWATYWHLRIIREIDLNEAETVEFQNAFGNYSALALPAQSIHPGLKDLEDIEKRWENPGQEEKKKYGRMGGEGRKDIRGQDVRKRRFLPSQLPDQGANRRTGPYLYKKIGYDWKITDKEWEKVRDELVNNLTNCGYPHIEVQDGDFNRRGELYLKHCHEGKELDVFYLEKTLPHVYTLWGKPVHLETMLDNKKVLFSYNGEKTSKKFI